MDNNFCDDNRRIAALICVLIFGDVLDPCKSALSEGSRQPGSCRSRTWGWGRGVCCPTLLQHTAKGTAAQPCHALAVPAPCPHALLPARFVRPRHRLGPGGVRGEDQHCDGSERLRRPAALHLRHLHRLPGPGLHVVFQLDGDGGWLAGLCLFSWQGLSSDAAAEQLGGSQLPALLLQDALLPSRLSSGGTGRCEQGDSSTRACLCFWSKALLLFLLPPGSFLSINGS